MSVGLTTILARQPHNSTSSTHCFLPTHFTSSVTYLVAYPPRCNYQGGDEPCFVNLSTKRRFLRRQLVRLTAWHRTTNSPHVSKRKTCSWDPERQDIAKKHASLGWPILCKQHFFQNLKTRNYARQGGAILSIFCSKELLLPTLSIRSDPQCVYECGSSSNADPSLLPPAPLFAVAALSHSQSIRTQRTQ